MFPPPTPVSSDQPLSSAIKRNQNKTLSPCSLCPSSHQSQCIVSTSDPCFHPKHPPKKVDNTLMSVLVLTWPLSNLQMAAVLGTGYQHLLCLCDRTQKQNRQKVSCAHKCINCACFPKTSSHLKWSVCKFTVSFSFSNSIVNNLSSVLKKAGLSQFMLMLCLSYLLWAQLLTYFICHFMAYIFSAEMLTLTYIYLYCSVLTIKLSKYTQTTMICSPQGEAFFRIASS